MKKLLILLLSLISVLPLITYSQPGKTYEFLYVDTILGITDSTILMFDTTLHRKPLILRGNNNYIGSVDGSGKIWPSFNGLDFMVFSSTGDALLADSYFYLTDGEYVISIPSVSGSNSFIIDSFGYRFQTQSEFRISAGSGTNDFLIDTASNIGIGTILPFTKLTLEGILSMKEQAAAKPDSNSFGQLWVRNTKELIFTNDTGVDLLLGLSAAGRDSAWDKARIDTFYIVDQSGSDTSTMWDDGDTTRWLSDNTIKIGPGSIIIANDGTVYITHDFYVGDSILSGEWAGNPVSIPFGGTGATTTAQARTNLGLVSGGAGDIWVDTAGDTVTGKLVLQDTLEVGVILNDTVNVLNGPIYQIVNDTKITGNLEITGTSNSDSLNSQGAAFYLARSNHTGTQGAATILDLQDSVTANSDVMANTVHVTSDGSDHTFINQDVSSTGQPLFDSLFVTKSIGIGTASPLGLLHLEGVSDKKMILNNLGFGQDIRIEYQEIGVPKWSIMKSGENGLRFTDSLFDRVMELRQDKTVWFRADILFENTLPNVNSNKVIFQGDDSGLDLFGEIQLFQGADSYIRISAPNDGGTPTPTLDIHDTNITYGNAVANIDYTWTVNGQDNNGIITYMEDEDRFDFDNDISVPGVIITGTRIVPDIDAGADIGTNSLAYQHAWIDTVHAEHYGAQSPLSIGDAGFNMVVGSDSFVGSPVWKGDMTVTGNVAGASPILPEHYATKGYTDLAVTGTRFDFYLTDSISDIGGGYLVAQSGPSSEVESSDTTTGLGVGNDQLLSVFATISTEPTFTTLSAGVISTHIHIERVSGTRSVVVYFVLYKRTAGGIETIITTSEMSGSITAHTSLDLHAVLPGDSLLNLTDRFIIKYFSNVSGGGSNVDIAIFMEGDNASLLGVPTNSEGLDQRYWIRTDDITVLNGKSIQTDTTANDSVLLKAVDNDTGIPITVAKLTGASDPSFDLVKGKLTGTLNANDKNITNINLAQVTQLTFPSEGMITLPPTSLEVVANMHNIDFNSGTVIQIVNSGAEFLTGMVFNTEFQYRIIINWAGDPFTVQHQNASSSAENRIITPRAADISLEQYQSITTWYDMTLERWIILSFTGTEI